MKRVALRRSCTVLCLALSLLMLGCAAWEAQRIEEMERERDLGEGYLATRDIPRAIIHLQKARRAYPKEPSVYFDLGLAFQAKGDTAEAERYFKKAIELRPGYSEVYLQLGNLEFTRGNMDKALEYYGKALENELYTTPHFAHFNIARVHHVRKDYDKAKAQYKKALRLVPDYSDAHYFLATIQMEEGDLKDALQSLKQAVRYGSPYPRASLALGKVYLEMGKRDKALASFRECLKQRGPEDVIKEAERLITLLGEKP